MYSLLTSLKRVVSILDAFVGSKREWTILELSRELGIPQPSIHHVL
ncbi:helix-turn-helix domain-containing protein [Bosea sp. RCC_152_1]